MSLSTIPAKAHWAIVQEVSVHIPGDERSRTNPGHGYPEHTETYMRYQAFTDEAQWKEEVEHLTLSKTPFRAMFVSPARITLKVVLEHT